MSFLLAVTAGAAEPPQGASPPERERALFAHGNRIVVQVSPQGGIMTLTNGTWVNQRLPCRTFLRGIAYGNGLFVAVGGSYIHMRGVTMTSHDGTTWIRRNSKNTTTLYSVIYGHGLFVAVGDDGAIFTSPSGLDWRHQHSGTSMGLAAIAFGNGTFVAGGESGTILASTNGVEWVRQCLGTSVYVGKIVFCDGRFLVRDSDATFSSTDGSLWLHRPANMVKTP